MAVGHAVISSGFLRVILGLLGVSQLASRLGQTSVKSATGR